MASKCQFPNCKHVADKTWALVDLCEDHYQDIKKETYQYYNGKRQFKIYQEDRTSYFAIAHLTPWKRKVKV
jgi:putative ribosome biogenesis GTPase RsgA